ncbi:siderophore-interacting protein, partial [Hansschlegelia beijingensis]
PGDAAACIVLDVRLPGQSGIELDGPGEEVRLKAPAGFEIRWLHRSAAPAEASPLTGAVASVARPEGHDPYAWVACEYGTAKAIRSHLRSAWKLARDRHMVVGYWERESAA